MTVTHKGNLLEKPTKPNIAGRLDIAGHLAVIPAPKLEYIGLCSKKLWPFWVTDRQTDRHERTHRHMRDGSKNSTCPAARKQ